MEDARAILATPTDNFTAELAGPNGLELVAEIVHDLRSPLTSIMFLADTLRKGQSGEINEIQRQQLGITYSAALGLVSVASNVIELARDGGMLPDADPAPFVLADVLESVRALVAPMAEEKGLEVVVDAPPVQGIRMGHAIALSRVLLNLTTNAIKFSEKGRVRVAVETAEPDTFAFSVQDAGRGIEPDVAVRMFEPFQRRDTGLRFSGTGLGLSICRRLVRNMGGELHYETEPGHGTRFFFELQLPEEFA
jgi:signal transduction histidine kinase